MQIKGRILGATLTYWVGDLSKRGLECPTSEPKTHLATRNATYLEHQRKMPWCLGFSQNKNFVYYRDEDDLHGSCKSLSAELSQCHIVLRVGRSSVVQ